MARPDNEAIETFMSITGVSEPTAIQKLQEHGGNLNEAVNAHFSEGERSITHERSVAAPLDDMMDVDDPVEVGHRRPPFPLMPASRNLNPSSLLDPNFTRSIFDSGPDYTNSTPFVSHPRQVREIPIEVKDGNSESGHSGQAPTIEDVTETAQAHGPEIHGTVIIDDDDNEGITTAPPARAPGGTEQRDRPIAPRIDDLPDYSNDIEEEMVRAAIEASKRDAENQQFGAHPDLSDPMPQQRQSHLEDVDLTHAVSLSLKTAEQEKALHEAGENAGSSLESEAHKSSEKEGFGNLASSNGRLDVGSSSVQDDFEDVEEQPLVRHGTRRVLSGSLDPDKEIEAIDVSSPASPQGHPTANDPPPNGGGFPSDEWGGISSLEHDEAVMLEAALFGGIPEGSGFHFPYAPHQFMQNGLERDVGPYPRRMPRPPSPSLEAQRLIREQQDDEYLASLQADREKELKAIMDAEAHRIEEEAASEEKRRKLEEEQEIERQLAAKEASLPQEPMPEDENAVTLLVRMPDGSRRGRRFLKSDKLQHLFDFIDIGRGVKPGTYRLVRPYPRRAFSVGESALTLDELGLTSKQEALFLELV